MDLGILFLGGDITVVQQTAIAKRAEESGFDSLFSKFSQKLNVV